MGWQTLLFVGLNALKAGQQMSNAKGQASAIIANASAQNAALAKEGDLAAQEKSKQVRYAAARQTASFLNSGLTLDGTPQDVLDDTFNTGLADINNIRDNYNTRIGNTTSAANAASKQAIGAGRAQAIGTIASSFAGADLGGSMGSMFSTGLSYAPDSASFALNDAGFGNTAFDALEKSDIRNGYY